MFQQTTRTFQSFWYFKLRLIEYFSVFMLILEPLFLLQLHVNQNIQSRIYVYLKALFKETCKVHENML